MATGQGNIAYLEVEAGKLKQVGHHKLDTEVACLDITPIGQAPIITSSSSLPPCIMSAQLVACSMLRKAYVARS